MSESIRLTNPDPDRARLGDAVPVLLADSVPAAPPELLLKPEVPVRPWVDDLVDTLGFDPRSAYVERFWLGILGPTTTWLLRRVAAAFDHQPGGFTLVAADVARELGLGDKGGRHSPFLRAVWRCCQFDLARVVGTTLEVRRHVPPVNRRQAQRLPPALQLAHVAWQQAQLGAPVAEAARRRARTLALTLLEVEPEAGTVEQRLSTWGVHPAVAHDAARWAWERHVAADQAAGAPA